MHWLLVRENGIPDHLDQGELNQELCHLRMSRSPFGQGGCVGIGCAARDMQTD